VSKTDGIDAELLLRTLLAWLRGEPRACSMVPIPAEADEDARRRMREREELLAERVGLVNRIGAILPTLGVGEYNPIRRDRRLRLDELRTALGGSLPTHAANGRERLRRARFVKGNPESRAAALTFVARVPEYCWPKKERAANSCKRN